MDTRFGAFAPVRSIVSTFVYPIQSVAELPDDLANWVSDLFEGRQQLKEKNADLEMTQLLNGQRLQKYENLERENMRLRVLLSSSFRLREQVKVAEILTIDLDPFSQKVLINKGSRSGIFVGQAVLDEAGVMGQVVSVGPLSSYVVLLTNPNHAVPVQINRNGLRAVITGRGLGKPLQLEFLPHNADVRVNDLLVTSGLGGRYPVGYPIGRISSINYPQGHAFADIRVKAAASLATSREVLMVVPSKEIGSNEMTSEEENLGNVIDEGEFIRNESGDE